jgi:hypothetical protein
MPPLYFKVMIVLAKYLAYPQRAYHAVRSSENPAIRIFTPVVLLIVMIFSLPAFAVASIAMMLAMRNQSQRENIGVSDSGNNSTESQDDNKEE